MEQEGIVAAEGCPHFITARRVQYWRNKFGPHSPTQCQHCTQDGFVPSQMLRSTKRKAYAVEKTRKVDPRLV